MPAEVREPYYDWKLKGRCIVCGADPGWWCRIVSGDGSQDPDQQPGAIRLNLHFYR